MGGGRWRGGGDIWAEIFLLFFRISYFLVILVRMSVFLLVINSINTSTLPCQF